MTMALPKPLIPLEDELAMLDSDEARAERHERAVAEGKRVVDDERKAVIARAGNLEFSKACQPRRLAGTYRFPDADRAAQIAETERMVTANVDALVVRQIEAELRIADERAVYANPDRQEEMRIWTAYLRLVNSIAFRHGNKSEQFVRRWRDLLASRADAERVGESTASMDRRLEEMSVPYPVFPAAAWEQADLLAESEREAEYLRLEAKYGKRIANGTTAKRGGK